MTEAIIAVATFITFYLVGHFINLKDENKKLNEQVQSLDSKERLESQDEEYKDAKSEADAAVDAYNKLKSSAAPSKPGSDS